MTNPLRELKRYGQSVWYDGRRRAMLVSGELARHIEEDGLEGLTTEAFREHGRAAPTLEADVEDARAAIAELAALGVSLDEVTDRLLEDGVRLFSEPFAKLLAAIEARRAAADDAGARA
jgi:transaldolase